jgi:hypothetical protein
MRLSVQIVTVLTFLLLPLVSAPRTGQDPPAATTNSDERKADFFSGIVTEVSQSSVTVHRKGLGQDAATHTFSIDGNTRVEGKLKPHAKVTVRFVSGDQGLVAVHIIVR